MGGLDAQKQLRKDYGLHEEMLPYDLWCLRKNMMTSHCKFFRVTFIKKLEQQTSTTTLSRQVRRTLGVRRHNKRSTIAYQ